MTADDARAGGRPAGLTDDELLRELGACLRAEQQVPAAFLAAARATWTWRTVDADLAELRYDSAHHQPAAVRGAVRAVAGGPAGAESAGPRVLTFTSDDVSIDLEVVDGEVVGQLVPARSAELVLEQSGVDPQGDPIESRATVPVDDVGWFRLAPAPAGRFRLNCTLPSGGRVVTGWISL